MFKPNYLLDTPHKVDAAIFNQLPITIYQQGSILDYGGVIESQNNETVKINGASYFKSACEFRVR